MEIPVKKPVTRILQRQIKKAFGTQLITDQNTINFINMVNDAYIFQEEESVFNQNAEAIANHDHIKLNEKLKEKNDFLDTFNNGMAHDVKNHTANIIGLIQMMKKYAKREDWKMINEIIKRLDESSNQLTSIVKGFLYLSRAEANIGDEVKTIENIELIKPIEEEIAYLKEYKEVEITYQFDRVFYNLYIMKIILVNLISNSIKYSKKDQPAIVKATLHSDAENVYLKVTDNGIGTDLKNNKKLYNLFNTTNTTKGYGVGLFLVKKIIDKNKGSVTVDSEVNKGTTIRITLPKKK